MHKRKAHLIGVLILLIAGVWVVFGQAGGVAAAGTTSASQTPPPSLLPGQRLIGQQEIKYPAGIPAIQPHLAATNTATGAPTPTFTADDARQYALSHAVWMATTIGSVTVGRIQFMTSGALSAQLGGESIGRPDTALVCYVELHGTFQFPAPKNGSVTVHIAYEVFDAQTGNLLMTGGRP